MGSFRQGVSPPSESGPSKATDLSDRALRTVRVKQSLQKCLDELEVLGLTLPAALVDNAIAEIR